MTAPFRRATEYESQGHYGYTDGRRLYVDDSGLLYAPSFGHDSWKKDAPKTGPQLMVPIDELWKESLRPGHQIDGYAPIRCAKCGTDRLVVWHCCNYETSARCPDCGTSSPVHSGS